MDDFPTRGSATVRIAATPDAIFSHLTDLSLLPQLSPENQRCEFLDGSSTIEVGTRFRGHNRSGDYEWHADCVVTVVEPGHRFEYQVPPDYEHATTWTYTISPDDDVSVVTESFHAPLLALPDVYPGRIEGRCANLERACETTMANLKATLERTGESARSTDPAV